MNRKRRHEETESREEDPKRFKSAKSSLSKDPRTPRRHIAPGIGSAHPERPEGEDVEIPGSGRSVYYTPAERMNVRTHIEGHSEKKLEDINTKDYEKFPGLLYNIRAATLEQELQKLSDEHEDYGGMEIDNEPRDALLHAAGMDSRAAWRKHRLAQAEKFKQEEKILDWVGVRESLGAGGQGCTRLFVKLDENQNVIDRMAVKETYVNDTTWKNPDFWFNQVVYSNPREAMAHKLCSLETPRGWENHVVKYIAHRKFESKKTIRIYMEYLDGGDLQNLINEQMVPCIRVNPDWRNADEDDRAYMTDYNDPVPQAFIWYFLKQMAKAMHRLNNIPLQAYRRNFVVHQDIKPGNIFATRPDSNDEFPCYPVLKLGDFGSARVTFNGDPKNPNEFRDPMTQGYRAPEMTVYGRENNTARSSATNVWQVAQTALHMMRLVFPEQIKYKSDMSPRDMRPDLEGLEDIGYSKELLELLRRCLMPNPERRPSPSQILEAYYANRTDWEDMQGQEALEWENSSFWLHSVSESRWMIGKQFISGDRDSEAERKKIHRRKEGIEKLNRIKAMQEEQEQEGGDEEEEVEDDDGEGDDAVEEEEEDENEEEEEEDDDGDEDYEEGEELSESEDERMHESD